MECSLVQIQGSFEVFNQAHYIPDFFFWINNRIFLKHDKAHTHSMNYLLETLEFHANYKS